MHSLGTLMKQNGRNFIDVVKVRCNHSYIFFDICLCLPPWSTTDSIHSQVDIEGWEYQTLSALLKQFRPSPCYLSVSHSSKFARGISTSQCSSSGGWSSKRRVFGPSRPRRTSFTPTITAVASHTYHSYVLFVFFEGFLLRLAVVDIVTNYGSLTSISKAITSLFLNSRVYASWLISAPFHPFFRAQAVVQSICIRFKIAFRVALCSIRHPSMLLL